MRIRFRPVISEKKLVYARINVTFKKLEFFPVVIPARLQSFIIFLNECRLCF